MTEPRVADMRNVIIVIERMERRGGGYDVGTIDVGGEVNRCRWRGEAVLK